MIYIKLSCPDCKTYTEKPIPVSALQVLDYWLDTWLANDLLCTNCNRTMIDLSFIYRRTHDSL